MQFKMSPNIKIIIIFYKYVKSKYNLKFQWKKYSYCSEVKKVISDELDKLIIKHIKPGKYIIHLGNKNKQFPHIPGEALMKFDCLFHTELEIGKTYLVMLLCFHEHSIACHYIIPATKTNASGDWI